MPLEPLPVVVEGLIAALEQRFSCGPPKAKETLEQLYVRAGHAEVIDYLKFVMEEQNTGSSQESTNVLFESEDTRPPSSPSGKSSRRQARRSSNR